MLRLKGTPKNLLPLATVFRGALYSVVQKSFSLNL